MQQEQSIFTHKSGNSFASMARGRHYKGSCATGVTSGGQGGRGRGADCDAAARAAAHTNSSGGPDVMMDGMCLIPADFLDFV